MIELSPHQFANVLPLFDKHIPLVNRVVSTLEGRTPGKVYVDATHQPTMSAVMINFYIIVLLGGNIEQNWIDHVVAELSKENEIYLVWSPPLYTKFVLPSGCSEVTDRFEAPHTSPNREGFL